MKYLTKTLPLLVVSMFVLACGGGDDNSSDNPGGGTLPEYAPARIMAFPGADGGARTITGGAGCDVYVVTNLNDDGDGSLRKGLRMSKTTVVFAVAGQINLQSNLEITASNITVAGQTAPGDGITLAGYPVFIKGSNVILRYLRFRMGDQNGSKSNFDAESGDALGAKDCSNILIDHCSMSWSTDECASFSRVENFTLQYCIIAESLRKSIHVKGNHGYGGIWGGKNASYHHNLIADHDSRTPRFDHHYVGGRFHGPIDYVNNVSYNWGGIGCYGGEADIESNTFYINMIGNFHKPGPNTVSTPNRLMQLTSLCTNCIASGQAIPAKLYLEGNIVNGTAATWDNIDKDKNETRDTKGMSQLNSRYSTGLTSLLFTETAQQAYETVLSCAGASKARDAVDNRIITQVRNNTGAIVDNTPAYPTLAAGTPITDTDNDGMPDSWETEQMTALGVTGKAVSEFKPSAYNLTAKYTNLEVYMNSLVVGTFPAGANAGSIK